MSRDEQVRNKTRARHIVLSGKVQGVGFRPFIYRIATQYQLSGWVRNRVGLVEVHVQALSCRVLIRAKLTSACLRTFLPVMIAWRN
jgi:acylphosphatase